MRPVTFVPVSTPSLNALVVSDGNLEESLIVDERTRVTSAEAVERKLQLVLQPRSSFERQPRVFPR